MMHPTFSGAIRTLPMIGALLGLMALSVAAHPVDDPTDPVYRARTVLPDAAKARRDAPALCVSYGARAPAVHNLRTSERRAS